LQRCPHVPPRDASICLCLPARSQSRYLNAFLYSVPSDSSSFSILLGPRFVPRCGGALLTRVLSVNLVLSINSRALMVYDFQRAFRNRMHCVPVLCIARCIQNMRAEIHTTCTYSANVGPPHAAFGTSQMCTALPEQDM
jgi:hypothetical protein